MQQPLIMRFAGTAQSCVVAAFDQSTTASPVAELVPIPCCCCSKAKQPFYYDGTPAAWDTGTAKIPALTPANLYPDLNIRSAKQPCYYDPSGILAPWLGKCAVNPVWFAAQKAHSKGAKADVLQVRHASLPAGAGPPLPCTDVCRGCVQA
jgi:hypothetical protein